tara:strand:+ start:940 stop:1110 length:171 start_codon:yes stop_codon:yes gene_type:complete
MSSINIIFPDSAELKSSGADRIYKLMKHFNQFKASLHSDASSEENALCQHCKIDRI